MDITQAELNEYASVDQQLDLLEERKNELRQKFIRVAEEAVKAGKVKGPDKDQPVLDVEKGALRVSISLGTKVANADWKVVRTLIEEKNCQFVNGGGKIVLLNDKLEDIIEKSRGKERIENNRVAVKPDVLK